ncbi:MAG: hypothetical protein D6773_17820, partial [Alphaproteobacteria bacterium]
SMLILGVTLSGLETLAVFLIGAGIMSLVLVRSSDGMLNARAAAMALATGCFIAGYSLVDGLGARVAGTAVGFYGWLSILNAVLFAAILQITRPGLLARLIPDAARPALVGGTASFLAYALVIWAFTQAPIALVTALRETSIIFALLIGVFFLREKLNLVKVAATIVTLSGAILLRYARG